jgi:hypothetical protein
MPRLHRMIKEARDISEGQYGRTLAQTRLLSHTDSSDAADTSHHRSIVLA